MPAEASAKGPPCAICDDDITTVKLCRKCRRDPANAGWSQRTLYGDRERLDRRRDDRHRDDLDARQRLMDLRDRKLRAPNERTRQILQLVGFYQITILVRPRGKARSFREWDRKTRPLHLAEVAHLVGVSRAAVCNTLRRYEPLMSALLPLLVPNKGTR